ncbi:MAG: hypothetical protein LBD17_03080 [Endomicrobium sp.]|jgi:hypothetical protein|nr:hypothetical protein [Endomicrobium sp.]
MKKYLMFMFCLVFAVSLVSFSGCKKKDNVGRQGQLQSPDPKNPESGTDVSTHRDEQVDSVKIVTAFTEKIGAGTRFIFEGYELSDGNKQCKISITRVDSNEKLVVTLGIAEWKTESMQTSAVEIGAFDDANGNKLFMVVADYNSQNCINLFCGVDRNCVTAGNPLNIKAYVRQSLINAINTNKYWTVVKNIVFAADIKIPKTIHPYWINTSDKPF